MKRIFLFLATNVAVLAVLSVLFQVFGVERSGGGPGPARKPARDGDELAAFGISGGIPEGLSRLSMSHPPLEQRIAALQHQYNIHIRRATP
jgi:hypothetical protein